MERLSSRSSEIHFSKVGGRGIFILAYARTYASFMFSFRLRALLFSEGRSCGFLTGPKWSNTEGWGERNIDFLRIVTIEANLDLGTPHSCGPVEKFV
jgi:hypothetical protein